MHQRLQFNLSFAKVEQIACPIKLWKFNGSPILFYRVNDVHDSSLELCAMRSLRKESHKKSGIFIGTDPIDAGPIDAGLIDAD